MEIREELEYKLQFMIPTLPKGEKSAALFIIDNLGQVPFMTLDLVAKESGCSSATITRLCKRMDYNGFLEFRNAIRNEALDDKYCEVSGEDQEKEQFKNLMQNVIDSDRETMESTLSLISDQYKDAGDAIINANKVFMFGNGDAIIPCESFSLKMAKIGRLCMYYSDQDIQIFAAGAADAGDVVIAVSHTGRSRSVVNAAKIAYEQGATVIGITAALKSPLQRYCTYVLYVGTKDTTDTKDIVSRRIGEYLVLETLYLYYNINIDSKVQDHRRKSADVIYSLKMDDSDESTGNPKLESG